MRSMEYSMMTSVNKESDIRRGGKFGTDGNYDIASTRNGTVNSQTNDLLKARPPFFFCRLVTSFPYSTFCLSLSFHISVIIVSGLMNVMGYDVFPTSFDTLPMELYTIPYRSRAYAFRDKDNFPNIFKRKLTNNGYPVWERGLFSVNASITLYYDIEGENLFTKEHFKKIKEIEDDIITTYNYNSSYCLTVNASLACAKPISILRYFDGTYRKLNSIFYDPSFSNIPNVLYEAYINNATMYDFKYFLPKNSTLSPNHAKASTLRTIIPVGCSTKGSKSCSAMETLSVGFLSGPIKAKLEQWRKSTSQFQFFYHSFVLWFNDLVKQAFMDMILVTGSVGFIFAFMVFHTRSLWLTCFAIFSIISSFIGTNIIYRYVLGYHYFGFFHILTMFIILGIGADDLFVFYDIWRRTASQQYPSLAHRLSDVFSKSAISMLITSVTTMAAFLCSAVSPLLVMRTFGLFSGILVMYNYLSVITFFPAVVVIFHLNYASFRWPCFHIFVPRNKSVVVREKCDKTIVSRTSQSVLKQKEILCHTESNVIRQKRLVTFFRNHFFHFITNKVFRWIILAVCIAVCSFFAGQIAYLEPSNEILQFYKKGHFYRKAADAEQYTFQVKSSQNLVTVYVVWGLRQNNRENCHFSDIDCRGENVYDVDFDPNPVKNQKALIEFCNTLYSFDANQISEYRIKLDSVNGHPQISCFTRDLNAFLSSKGLSLGMNLSLPWNHTILQQFMQQEDQHFSPTKYNSSFPNMLDIPVQYWLYNGYNMNYTKDYGMYNKLIGERISDWSHQLKSQPSVKYGNNLAYIAVEINTTISRYTTGYRDGIPLVEKWEKLVNDLISKMPGGLQGGFQLTEVTWHWLYVQKSMTDNAILGVVIGLSLAFIIITLATMNIVLGFLSTLCIMCTTVSVVGVIPAVGWKLGLLESLNMCMLVGLAVDYVVHLSKGYHQSRSKDRLTRTRDMLEEIAISVFSGACTTLGASMFMFFAQIQFFMQFGIFLFCTIGFSLLYSLGLFTVLMGVLGPENNTGCLRTMAKTCFNKFRKSNC